MKTANNKLTENEHEKCKKGSRAIWGVEKFKLQPNETILLLQYYELVREEKERAEERMGHLRFKANECEYKKKDRICWLKS